MGHFGSQRHKKKTYKDFILRHADRFVFHINDQAADVGWESRSLF